MTEPVNDALLRIALVCWSLDPSHGMTPTQHAWLTARLAARTPLSPEERTRLHASCWPGVSAVGESDWPP